MNAEALGGGAVDSLALFGKAALALVFIVVLILLCSYLLKRFNLHAGQPGQLLRVVSSAALGPRERVVIVEVEGTWLVLGVGGGQVSKLHELRAPERPPEPHADAAGFASRLRQAGLAKGLS